MAVPLKNRGVIKTAQYHASLAEIPIPTLRPEYILVRTIAVALNPTDWQTVDETLKDGTPYALLGCDAAGIVVEVGDEVTKDFKVGDRIAGMAHGGNDLEPQDGTFAQYILLKADIAMHIPPNITFEEAATLPGGLATVALALYKHISLPLPTFSIKEGKKEDGRAILIYGGSTASGTLAIQFAKLSGLQVLTTASPHNFPLLKSLGADHVLDYRDPKCGSKINALTQNTLTLVLDTIATPASAEICAQALSSTPTPNPSTYVNLMGIPFPRPESEVRNIFFLGYTVSGEAFEIEGERWEACAEDFELAKRMMTVAEDLVGKGTIKAHPAKVMDGGLEGILGGMRLVKEGISGVKLVYKVGEV
ncbi:putative zinc-binding oxidoreductase ToxD [Stipitochalara longipes BDJ]|nr:putative zinc-binding oxidoreductase ToxD [Stipitochalara longipes BDJ]